jgi:hypothetical protein
VRPVTKKRVRIYHDERRFERVDDEDLYERIDEDEEVVEDDEEVVEEDEEVVVEDDEEVVAKPAPSGEGAVEAYIWGLGSLPPPSTTNWLYAIQELKRLMIWKEGGASNVQNLDARLKQAKRAVFDLCPERASGSCPLYNLSVRACVVNLEKVCAPIARGRALAERRRRETPRKWRSWYRG